MPVIGMLKFFWHKIIFLSLFCANSSFNMRNGERIKIRGIFVQVAKDDEQFGIFPIHEKVKKKGITICSDTCLAPKDVVLTVEADHIIRILKVSIY